MINSLQAFSDFMVEQEPMITSASCHSIWESLKATNSTIVYNGTRVAVLRGADTPLLLTLYDFLMYGYSLVVQHFGEDTVASVELKETIGSIGRDIIRMDRRVYSVEQMNEILLELGVDLNNFRLKGSIAASIVNGPFYCRYNRFYDFFTEVFGGDVTRYIREYVLEDIVDCIPRKHKR